MIGIYKITNKINQHCYIGQSRQIEKRWSDHIIAAFNQNQTTYNYPLYRAIRKYGLINFSFEILEECLIEELNNKEIFWIKFYNPVYNQTIGGDYKIVYKKLTEKQVKEIQQILIKDSLGKISHKQLAEEYNVSKDTIRDINVGRTWKDDTLKYPLHYSQYDSKNPNKNQIKYCVDCGKQISKDAIRCLQCENKKRSSVIPVSREELKVLIRQSSFVNIGKKFGLSDNAIRKWCDKYNLPRSVREIKKISDKDWEKI